MKRRRMEKIRNAIGLLLWFSAAISASITIFFIFDENILGSVIVGAFTLVISYLATKLLGGIVLN